MGEETGEDFAVADAGEDGSAEIKCFESVK